MQVPKNFFGIWNFASKHGLTYNLVASIDVLHYCPVLTRSSVNRYFNNFISAGIEGAKSMFYNSARWLAACAGMHRLPRPLQAACWCFSACRPTSREENAGLSRRGVERRVSSLSSMWDPVFLQSTVVPALKRWCWHISLTQKAAAGLETGPATYGTMSHWVCDENVPPLG